VFERKHFLGKVFSVTDSYGTTTTKELTYSVISPSTYEIFIPEYSGVFSFVLSESFSDKWYISREGPNKFGIFPLFKYASGNPVDYVTKDFRGLNLTEFVFSDASYSGQTIYVYYRDQEYLKIGLILSLILTSLSFTITPVVLRKARFVGKDISK